MKNLENRQKYGMKIFGIIRIKIIKSSSILEDFLLDNKKERYCWKTNTRNI